MCIRDRVWGPRPSAVSAEARVPPEKNALDRMKPSTVSGTPSGSCRTVKYAPRSAGIESKPQACTSRAPVSRARASCSTYIRSTNSGSPVRST